MGNDTMLSLVLFSNNYSYDEKKNFKYLFLHDIELGNINEKKD